MARLMRCTIYEDTPAPFFRLVALEDMEKTREKVFHLSIAKASFWWFDT